MPVLTLVPEVAAVLPGQEEVVLSCTTNSDRLSVRWLSDGSILSYNSTYRVQLPSESSSYNCSIIDPISDTILISAAVPVINVQGKPINKDVLVLMLCFIRNLECLERW